MLEFASEEIYGGPLLVPVFEPGDEKLLIPTAEIARMIARPGLELKTCLNAVQGYLRAGLIHPAKVRLATAEGGRNRHFFRGETALICATLQAVSSDVGIADPVLLDWVAGLMGGDFDNETKKAYGAENLARNGASHVISVATTAPHDWRLIVNVFRHRETGRVVRRPILLDKVSGFETVLLLDSEFRPTAAVEIALNPLLASVYAERPVAN